MLRNQAIPLVPLALALASCADLPPFERGVCGNGVVEPERGEDCDSFAPEGLSCGAAGDARVACRYTCSSSGPGCPEGWACGGDGLCRYASGSFESGALGGRFLGEVEHLSSGDFDGDGRTDLFALTRGAVSLRYGSAEGLTGEFDLPFPSVGAPAVADLDEDGRADVVVPQSEGLVILRGEVDRSLHPVPSPFVQVELPDTQLRAIPVLSRRFVGESFLVVAATSQGMCLSLTTEIDDCATAGQRATVIAFQGADPEPRLGWARRFVTGSAGSVELIAVAVAGEQRAHLVEVSGCAPEQAATCVEGVRRVRTLPALDFRAELPALALRFIHADGRVMLADHDGDGLPDLLIGVRYSGALPGDLAGTGPLPDGGVLVALGTPEGFAAPRLEPVFHRLAYSAPGVEGRLFGSSWPLAGGQLAGDARADYVGAAGVFLRGDDGLVWIGGPSLGVWAEAVVGDLNRDGLADVAASFQEVEGIDFLQGTGYPALNPTLIGTRGRARVLRTGDFDGDLVFDLAFVDDVALPASPGGEERVETRVKVSFGNLQGPPGAPVDIGPLPGVVELVPALYTNGDLIWDLLVHAEEPNSARTSMAMLAGTTRRRMFSTLVPPPAEGAAGALDSLANPTLGVMAGRFEPGGVATDIVTVRRRDQWLFSGTGDVSFPSDRMNRLDLEADCPQLEPRLDPTCAAATTGRLHPSDPAESVVAFESMAGCGMEGDRARLTVLRIVPPAGEGKVQCWSTEVAPLPGGIPTQARLVDLDGAGQPELVVVYGFGEVAGGRSAVARPGAALAPTAREASGLAVYWNLGGPDFDRDPGVEPGPGESPASYAASEVVQAGDYADGGHVESTPVFGAPNRAVEGLVPGFLAVSPIAADEDPELELLVLTTEGLFVMDFSGNPEVPRLRLLRWGAFDRTDRLHTADVDGDGLPDVVLGRGASFEVILSVPHDRARGRAP